MKKNCLVLVLLATIFMVFAEQYQITDIQYELDGRTKEYALSKALNIRKDRIFESQEEIQLYIDFISQKLSVLLLKTKSVIFFILIPVF